MSDKSLYADKRVHSLQTIWIWVSAFAIPSILRASFNSFWLWAIVSFVAWVVVSWIGISLISLLDYNHRMATKYNIKIENIPFYEKVFEELVEKEAHGIDSFGIPQEIQDVEEWLRFCRWQMDKGLKEIRHE